MKKVLRVTWQDGDWSGPEKPPPTGTIDLSASAAPKVVGGDTLMFYSSYSMTSPVALVIPASRLISAVQVEVPDA